MDNVIENYAEVGFNLSGAIAAEREKSLAVGTAISELIDNSIDARARLIEITELGNDLIITDDGSGIDDIAKALQIGESSKGGRSQIGRYGVGMKLACIKFSSATTIKSRNRYMSVDWDEIITGDSKNRWPIVHYPFVGTEITLHGFSRMRSTQAINPDAIAKTYGMLLESGCAEIRYNGKSLAPLELPTFTESINERFNWRGRSGRIVGGIYPTDDPKRRTWSGYFLYYNGRLIGRGGDVENGTGEFRCTNWAFIVYLEDGINEWTLGTHKDGIKEAPELLEYLFDHYTSGLIEKASETAQFITLRSVEDRVSDILNGRRNGKRDNGNHQQSGTIERKFTDRKRIFTAIHDGEGEYVPTGSPVRKDYAPKAERLAFRLEKHDGTGLGICSKHKDGISYAFNLNNSFINHFREQVEVLAPLITVIDSLNKTTKSVDLFAEKILEDAMKHAGERLHQTDELYSDKGALQ
jgi:hypothetical protein